MAVAMAAAMGGNRIPCAPALTKWREAMVNVASVAVAVATAATRAAAVVGVATAVTVDSAAGLADQLVNVK